MATGGECKNGPPAWWVIREPRLGGGKGVITQESGQKQQPPHRPEAEAARLAGRGLCRSVWHTGREHGAQQDRTFKTEWQPVTRCTLAFTGAGLKFHVQGAQAVVWKGWK